MNNRLTDEKFWKQSYGLRKFSRKQDHDPIVLLIRKFIPETRNLRLFEIGSFPGQFLPIFGELGYQLNGIDILKDNEKLKSWLISSGYDVGKFYVGDLMNFEIGSPFDLVVSFGFIEHFTNYDEIINRHVELLNSTGTLLITTPNYRGILQKILHYYYDKENLQKHFLPSMNPTIWKNQLEAKGFDVKFYGYFGGMKFWLMGKKMSPIKSLMFRGVLKILHGLDNIFRFDSQHTSCYCGIIAMKRL